MVGLRRPSLKILRLTSELVGDTFEMIHWGFHLPGILGSFHECAPIYRESWGARFHTGFLNKKLRSVVQESSPFEREWLGCWLVFSASDIFEEKWFSLKVFRSEER